MIWRGFADGESPIRKISSTEAKLREGIILIGLPSSGITAMDILWSERYFSIRWIWMSPTIVEELGTTLGDALIMPTRIYVKACKALFGKFDIHGIVHMTSGGFMKIFRGSFRTAWVRKSKRVPGKFGNFQVY